MKPVTTSLPLESTDLHAALKALTDLAFHTLPRECALLIRILPELTGQNIALREENERLRHELSSLQEKVEEGVRKGWQLEELKRMLFGKKSERFTAYSNDKLIQPALSELFEADDIEAVITASRARTAAQQQLTAAAQELPPTDRHRKRHLARKGKRRPIEGLERIVTTMDYPGDKSHLKPMGKKVVVVYDYIPGKIVQAETHFLKYIDKEGHIYKAPVPPRIIEKGTVGNSLIAWLHTEKFVYHAPYYRQLQKIKRLGVQFAASTVNDWEEICYQKLKRLLKLMKKLINQQDYLQMDEVPIDYVNDVGKGHCSRGYFWVVNAPRQKMVLFHFNAGRSSAVPKELLSDFTGKLQCDGFSSYKTAFKDSEKVTLLTCLVHIRRDFFKALSSNKALAEYFINETRIIYDIEAHADKRQLSDQQRVAIRRKHVQPILEQLQKWLTTHKDNVPPDAPICKAINYALNHWSMLYHYVEDGRVSPDNNGVERAIRPVTLYRNNSLFAGNPHGAERAALYFSLLETCKLHQVNPFEYLCDVYDRIHDCPAHQLEELLPHKWTKSIPAHA